MELMAVRIFARLGDGTLRMARRVPGSPGWSWPLYEGGARNGEFDADVIVSVSTAEQLPANPAALFALPFGA